MLSNRFKNPGIYVVSAEVYYVDWETSYYAERASKHTIFDGPSCLFYKQFFFFFVRCID